MEQNAPRLRFPGFSGEWEKKTLEEISVISTGYPFDSKSFSNDGKYLVITNGNIQDDSANVDDSIGNHVTITDKKVLSSYLLNIGDILVTMDGTVGRTAKVIKNDQILAQRVGRIKALINSEFLYQWLNTGTFSKTMIALSHGGTIKHISLNEIRSYKSRVPSLPEQEKIADFFSALDEKIDLKEKEIEDVKSMKKGFLQKMFPQDGESVPRLRFPGFSGEWEKKALGDIIVQIKRKDSESKAPVMMISATEGFIKQSEKYSRDNAGKSLKKYTILHKGELAYNHGASKIRPYGSSFVLKEKEARVPFVYHSFSTKDNPEFLEKTLNGRYTQKQLKRVITSGARMDGLLNITFENFAKIKVSLPSLPEQEKIADFFSAMDAKIDTMEKQLEDLKEMKKGFLQQMFI